jgi:N-glycosidase YbiA
VALAKFSGDPALSDLLLGTGDAELVEAGFIDDDAGRFWGRVNGIGENWLGRILMETRDRLRRSPYEVIM